MVKKAYPEERVGVFAQQGDAITVVEYRCTVTYSCLDAVCASCRHACSCQLRLAPRAGQIRVATSYTSVGMRRTAYPVLMVGCIRTSLTLGGDASHSLQFWYALSVIPYFSRPVDP